jgi:hypothetical protein
MSISLVANFVHTQNLVLPLAQSATKPGLAVRVASTSSGTLGTITGTNGTGPLVWSVTQNPAWISIAPSADTTVLTISFVNATSQPYPYQFLIACTDGITTAYFPILLEVKDPLSLSIQSGGGTVITANSYDFTVADTIVQGIGVNGIVDAGVSFIPPATLPNGLEWLTSDESALTLRVAPSTASNLPGGLAVYTGSPTTTQFNVTAYKPGTMYDNPSRAFITPFTVKSLAAKQGTPDVAVSLSQASNGVFDLAANVDFLGGQAPAVTYEWDIAGSATGTVSTGSISALALTWTCATAGLVSFVFKVKNATTGVILAQVNLNPSSLGVAQGITCSPSASWETTNAVKIELSTGATTGIAGATPTVTVSTPVSELNSGETITLTLTTNTASALEQTTATTVGTITLNAGSPSATMSLPIPPSNTHQKWSVSIAAANASSSPTRTGFAQAVFLSSGAPAMTVASNVGQPIFPVTLFAQYSGDEVANTYFYLLDAPAGLIIANGTDSAQLTGNVLVPGTYTFTVVAQAEGFATSQSALITLVASPFSAPLQITDPVPSVPSLPDGTQFNVNWGVSGTPSVLNFIQNFNVRSVLGSTSAAATENGNSLIGIYGGSFYGDAYSIPTVVLSSSIVAAGTLLNAPTVGVIDEYNDLTLNWQPAQVDGSFQAYADFNIYLTLLPNGSPQLQTVDGALPTGLEIAGSTPDSRIFEEHIVAGNYAVSMQALSSSPTLAQNAGQWDEPHDFPTAITLASVTFDNQTLEIGQTVNISLDPNYSGADSWCVFYPDGTNSGFLPLSIRTIAKSFTAAGTQILIVQTQNDFSSSNPGVKLHRQVTTSVFVMNQQFNGQTGTSALAGTLGFGGNAGFEITNANNATTASTTVQPFEVITRALVRDSMNNELKLMVATARTADASSQLGTMAIDVFPLAGRPRSLEPVDLGVYLSAEQAHIANPIRITTATLPNAVIGKPLASFQMQVAANTGVAPFSWYADQLPDGLNLSINGVISGTPVVLGSFSIDFSVVDSNNPAYIGETTLVMTVETDLTITTTTLAPGVVGTDYEVTVAQTGGIPPYTWEIVSGQPPVGISIDPNTGTLNGTPVTYNSTTDFAKTFVFTVQVSDAVEAQASAALSMTLNPAAVGFGSLDQSEVFANQDFRLNVPVVGGRSPYQLVAFADDGVVGTGLGVVNPPEIDVIAGVVPAALTVTTPAQYFFPEALPFDPLIVLAASGGQPPYTFSIPQPRIYANPALPRATVYGDLLLSTPDVSADFSIEVEVTDQRGEQVSQLIDVQVFEKGWNGYTIQPVTVATNGSTNPANFTITQISALPNAKLGQPYDVSSGVYYGLALSHSGTLVLTQLAGGSGTPMNFTLHSGSLPAGIVAFSANSFGASTDYSGLVMFNVSGGSNPSVSGSSSFEAEFSNIRGAGGVTLPVVLSRQSITVTPSGTGTTPVVVVTTSQSYSLNLSLVSGLPYAWYYPLNAEGGTGPYTFHIQSGTTLPNAVLTNNPNMFYSSAGTVFVDGVPLDATNNALPVDAIAFSSTSVTPGTYEMIVTATDTNGVVSPPVTIAITVTESVTETVNIVVENLPALLYQGQALTPNTYFVESDIQAVWSATGLPPGVELTATAGTFAYLSGTPTSAAPALVTITATSTAYNTTASITFNLPTLAQTAVFLDVPTKATIATAYRSVNNNAIITVQYTGYQPGNPLLPLVTSLFGLVGAPGVSNGGTPTVAVSNLTPTGFTMEFDYTAPVIGNDVISLVLPNNTVIASFTLPVSYAPLRARGSTANVAISEYSQSTQIAPPVSVSGGLTPYTLTPTSFSDVRFSASGGLIVIDPNNFTTGQTFSCSVQIAVADSSGLTTTAVGIVTVTIEAEVFVAANFTPGVWNIPLNAAGSPAGVVSTFTAIVSLVTPTLGHAPFQIYTDAVSFAPPAGTTGGSSLGLAYAALGAFVNVSPTRNVLYVCYGAAAVVADTIFDELSTRTQGNLINTANVIAASESTPPPPGSYTAALTLRVVDSEGLATSQVVPLTINVTA